MQRIWMAVAPPLLLLVLGSLAPAVASEAGPRPDWWPEGKVPPFASLAGDTAESPRTILLGAARFATGPSIDEDFVASRVAEALRGAPIDEGGWLIVQFAPDTSPAERLAILSRHGALAGDAIPQHARLAHVPAAAVRGLGAEPGVVWIGRLHPAYKLAGWLGQPSPAVNEKTVESAPAPWRLLLSLAPGADPAAAAAAAGGTGARVLESSSGQLRVDADDDATLVALARLDDVLFVEPWPGLSFLNNDARWVCQSGVTGSEPIHGKGIRGGNQTIAIMDSGVEPTHCCFNDAGKIVDNRAWGGGQLGAGCNGDHGTHVSGTALCSQNGDHDGLAPDARLIMQDVGKSTNCNSVYPPSPLSSAWNDAKSRGARVHSNSWGGGWNTYGADAQAIDAYMWNNQDFLILFAAGNSGPGSGSLSIHSNAKNSVTVGGSRNGTGLESLYLWSSRGPAGDGRLLPDLTAPAETVYSAYSSTACGWIGFGGTSMATPAVAGSAGLVREYFQRGFYPSGVATLADGFSPSAALVKATLLLSARNMANVSPGRPDNAQGYGRVTLDDALWFPGDAATSRLIVLDDRTPATGFTAAGQEHTFALDVLQPGPVRIVLAWTDAPGSLLAAKALVNDLDLVVTTPDGKTYAGNQGFSGGWTATPSTTGDRLNNKEAVYLSSVAGGTVTVKVKAVALGDVAAHPQDYALVAVAPSSPSCSAPAPTGVGNTVRHDRAGFDLAASWADRAADHYVVYRGTTPDFFLSSPPPYRNDIHDAEAGIPGIQWRDTAALASGTNYFYLYHSANVCGQEVP